jgi:hypothetical protein
MFNVAGASTRSRHAAVVVVVGVLVVALATVGLWLSVGNDTGVEGAESSALGPGPLTIKAGKTELVFPGPRQKRASGWSAVAGGFLLCGPGAGEVTLTKVAPLHGDHADSFASFTRTFTIDPDNRDLVAEPVIGAYGQPPRIGGIDNPHEDQLLGPVVPAVGAEVDPPACEDTTSAPGETAVELMVGASAGPEGASFDGVTVDYEIDGRHYQAKVAVRVTLCGSQVTNSDC